MKFRIFLDRTRGPPVSLLWDSGFLDMVFRILLVIHIISLEKTTLASLMYEEQKKRNWPGLPRETANICVELDMLHSQIRTP